MYIIQGESHGVWREGEASLLSPPLDETLTTSVRMSQVNVQ